MTVGVSSLPQCFQPKQITDDLDVVREYIPNTIHRVNRSLRGLKTQESIHPMQL